MRSSIIPVLFSSLSRLQNDEIAYKRCIILHKGIQRILYFNGLGLFLYSDLATSILFGNKWSEARYSGDMVFDGAIGIVFSNFNGEVYRSRVNQSCRFIKLYICVSGSGMFNRIGYGFWPLVYTRVLMRLQGNYRVYIYESIYGLFSQGYGEKCF